jgi:hypothetical protein
VSHRNIQQNATQYHDLTDFQVKFGEYLEEDECDQQKGFSKEDVYRSYPNTQEYPTSHIQPVSEDWIPFRPGMLQNGEITAEEEKLAISKLAEVRKKAKTSDEQVTKTPEEPMQPYIPIGEEYQPPVTRSESLDTGEEEDDQSQDSSEDQEEDEGPQISTIKKKAPELSPKRKAAELSTKKKAPGHSTKKKSPDSRSCHQPPSPLKTGD